MTAKEYIETVAQELGRVRGRGLLLSSADAQLALSWHAGGVPLAAVIAVLVLIRNNSATADGIVRAI